jgi:hypothetical protein
MGWSRPAEQAHGKWKSLGVKRAVKQQIAHLAKVRGWLAPARQRCSVHSSGEPRLLLRCVPPSATPTTRRGKPAQGKLEGVHCEDKGERCHLLFDLKGHLGAIWRIRLQHLLQRSGGIRPLRAG